VELISIPAVVKVKLGLLHSIVKPSFYSSKYQDPLQSIFEYVAGVSNEYLSGDFILGGNLVFAAGT
jgi:hypothetical protein